MLLIEIFKTTKLWPPGSIPSGHLLFVGTEKIRGRHIARPRRQRKGYSGGLSIQYDWLVRIVECNLNDVV